jgi:hypothetical protein
MTKDDYGYNQALWAQRLRMHAEVPASAVVAFGLNKIFDLEHVPSRNGDFYRIKHKPLELHYSSCAVNNAPALPPGPCDCGGYKGEPNG